jgi:Spy/CpxP family protein refolding chaperone
MILTLAASCASGTKKEIEADKKAIGTVATEKELVKKAKEILKDSKLSQEKKDKFYAIAKKYRSELESLTKQIKQHRLLLVKTISSDKFSHKKFNKVQKELKSLVNKRFDVYINQYMDAKEVIGAEMQNVYDDPWFEMHHRF